MNKMKTDISVPTGGIYSILSDFFMGVVSELYDLRLIDKTGKNKPILRKWESKQVLANIDFLQSNNLRNYNIYIRPLDNRFILLDDLERDILTEVAKIKPCLLMETSPGNYQVWLKMETVPDNRELLKNMWRQLAVKFNADLASAKPDQIGRLPGFLNMKQKYSPDFPFVKLHNFENRFCTWNPGNLMESPPVVINHKKITKSQGRDRSAFDFAIACSMLEKGYSDTQIKARMMQYSEKAQQRGERYLNMTLAKAKKKIL